MIVNDAIDDITEVNQRHRPKKRNNSNSYHSSSNTNNENERCSVESNYGTNDDISRAILELAANDDGGDHDDDHRRDRGIDHHNDDPKQQQQRQQQKKLNHYHQEKESDRHRNGMTYKGKNNSQNHSVDHIDDDQQCAPPRSPSGQTSVIDERQAYDAATISDSFDRASLVNSSDFRIKSDVIDRDATDDDAEITSRGLGQLQQDSRHEIEVTFMDEDDNKMDGIDNPRKSARQPHPSLKTMTSSKNDSRFNKYQWMGLLILDVVIIFIITTSIVLHRRAANNKDYNNVNTNINNDLDGTDGGVEPYQGNWTVRDFPQISQHFVMIYVKTENCSTVGTDPLPNLYYTIQCGPNQTIATTESKNNTRVDMSQRPTAAIELETSPQRGNCLRTQVNVLTCNTAVTEDVVSFVTCGTSNETTEMNDGNSNSSLPPLLTVQTHPVTALSCSTDIDRYNESSYDHNQATYITSVESKSHTNVAWISTNLLCNNSILSNILDPWSCRINSNMITIDDPSGTLGNWTYCLSTNAREEEEEMNHTNVAIIPSMKVLDRYNKSLYQEICPYMEKYTPPNLHYYFGISTTIMGRLLG